MITANIQLGKDVSIESDATINNVSIGDNTKIAKGVRIFGSAENQMTIGKRCYFGPNCIVEGFNAKVTIGDHVSFAQNINLMTGSGPNASEKMQQVFPIQKGNVTIGDHSWVGASAIIMPNVTIGKCCIIAANSFVNKSFPDYSIIGGTPAKLIRKMTDIEIEKLNNND